MLRPEPLKRPAFRLKAATVLRPSLAAYREFLANDHLPTHELQRLQDERSITHARFAMEHSRFYADLYRSAGFRPDDLDDPAAFEELPTVTKADVREHFDDFATDEATDRNTATNVTGGSTGEPLRLLRDVRVPARALEWRLFHWWGVNPAVDVALVQRHTKSARQALKHNATWWPSARFQLDAFHMDSDAVAAFVRRWQDVRPGLLIGYAGAIAELALMIQRQRTSLLSPHAVAVTAAPVTDPQRRTIEEAFGAPVYDHYRSSEVPWIAGECSAHDGLHVFADVRRVEILDEAGVSAPSGEIGDVVVTDLTNRVFPLIRYRLGDRSSTIDGACPCGVGLPRITPIRGRAVDALRLPGGQVVAGEGLAQIFSKTPDAVRQFQIHQNDDYSVVLKCVPSESPGSWATVDTVSENLRIMLNHRVPVTCERVTSIPHIGGKARCVVSDVH